jgi:GTP 3',8-cyclase
MNAAKKVKALYMNPLVDLYNRQIKYVRISVTDRCNLRCRYCMPGSGVKWVPHEKIMRYEEYLRILSLCVSRGVEKVRITGGEPLIREGLCNFIAAVNELQGLTDISLTTNGLLLSSMVHDLKKAGLRRINISLDTLNKDKFSYITRIDAFDKVIEGIVNALDSGLSPVKVNVVAIRGFNDDEIPDFARVTLSMPVEVRFIELMPLGCVSKYPEQERITATEIKESIEKACGPLEQLEGGLGPAVIYKLSGALGKIGLIGSMSDHGFCSKCNRIRITATGTLRPCLFSEQERDILGPMRSGVTDDELQNILEEGVKQKPLSHGTCRGQQIVPDGLQSLMLNIGG